MAIITQDGLITALATSQYLPFYKASFTTAVGSFYSFWTQPGMPGAGSAPSSAAGVVPTSATAGALPFTNPGGGNLSYLGRSSVVSTSAMVLVLYDRLVHSDSLSGTSTSAQTIGTPAITRPNSAGTDVELWLEWYTATGATSVTATIAYTNDASASGRSATVVLPANVPAGRMLPVSLQAGDIGVQSVQSLTLSASTLTSGNFGVTLLRRYITLLVPVANVGSALSAIQGGLPQIADSACLAKFFLAQTTTSGSMIGEANVIQG